MSQRSNVRLFVLGALMLSLVLTLIGRLFYLQVMTGEEYKVAAVNNTVREVVEPAVRGLILDQAGRPLVSNRTSLVITVDKIELSREPDGGEAVIERLGRILDLPRRGNRRPLEAVRIRGREATAGVLERLPVSAGADRSRR